MRIRIETDENVREPEITIRCGAVDETVLRIQTAITTALHSQVKLALLRDGKDYYLAPNQILFFEAVDGRTFAHTPGNIYRSRLKLYELEEILPRQFVRIAKGTIVNSAAILSITRNLTGPSLVQFRGSHKQVSVSRSYYKTLESKLNERRI